MLRLLIRLDGLLLKYFQTRTENIQVVTGKTCYWLAWVLSFVLALVSALTINMSIVLAVQSHIWLWLGVAVLPLIFFVYGILGIFMFYNIRTATRPVKLTTDESRLRTLFNTLGSSPLPILGLITMVQYGRPLYEVWCVIAYLLVTLIALAIEYLESCHPLPPEALEARRTARIRTDANLATVPA